MTDEARDPTRDDYAAFRVAESNGWTDVLNQLIVHKHVNPQELFDWAWTEDQPMAAGAILAHVNDFDIDPTTFKPKKYHAIQWASEKGHAEIVELLLNWKGKNGKQVDPTDWDNHPIRRASEYGHDQVVELLLAWKGEDDQDGQRVNPTVCSNKAIEIASENGHDQVVKLLLDWRDEDNLDG